MNAQRIYERQITVSRVSGRKRDAEKDVETKGRRADRKMKNEWLKMFGDTEVALTGDEIVAAKLAVFEEMGQDNG